MCSGQDRVGAQTSSTNKDQGLVLDRPEHHDRLVPEVFAHDGGLDDPGVAGHTPYDLSRKRHMHWAFTGILHGKIKGHKSLNIKR